MPMTKPLFIAGSFILIVATIMAIIWWTEHPKSERRGTDVSDSQQREDSNSATLNSTKKSDGVDQSKIRNMSDLEFRRLKVTLPKPVNEPWSAPFFSSQNYFEANKKETAVDVLPIWIRLALLDGDDELAARYFWSLLELSKDDDVHVSAKAIFAIYRMGDYDRWAADEMQKWIESGLSFRYSDTISASAESTDIRTQVMKELDLNKDLSLIPAIYDAWLRSKDVRGKELSSVDFGYYLETHGRELPNNYWMQRLDSPYGFDSALEVVEMKGLPEARAKLIDLFESLRDQRAETTDASRAANVASLLFKETQGAQYLVYLIDSAQTQLVSGSFHPSLSDILNGLAATGDAVALEIVSDAMQNENGVIRHMAIDALGDASDPVAADILVNEAVKKAKARTYFPEREMMALLAQDVPSSDSKYERLQKDLLSGKLGWPATTADFKRLEYFRKYDRH